MNKENTMKIVGWALVLALLYFSYTRYEIGSKSIDSEIGSSSLAVLLIICMAYFPYRGWILPSAGIFLVSILFSLSSYSDTIINEYAKFKKPLLVQMALKDPLPDCPSAAESWFNFAECKEKFPQKEKERLEYNLNAKVFNDALPALNKEIQNYNENLSFMQLPINSRFSILKWIMLAVGIPFLELFIVFRMHNETGKAEEGASRFIQTIRKVFNPYSREEMLSRILAGVETKDAVKVLSILSYKNEDMTGILNKSKGCISKVRSEIEPKAKQQNLFEKPSREERQLDLITAKPKETFPKEEETKGNFKETIRKLSGFYN